MNERTAFTLKYTLFCTFVAFLMITVFAKHYQLDAGFYVPVCSAFPGALLAGWWGQPKQFKFKHTKIGVFALLLTFLFSWLGFWMARLMNPDSILQISALKALADAWLAFLAGALIMVPAFVLLTYLAENQKKDETESADESEMKVEE